MNRVWVTGYRNYELGIFDEKAPRALITKKELRSRMRNLIENGADWIITGAQLGTEQWTVQIANELKQDYPGQFKIGVMLPFKNFGSQWNEDNQARLQQTLALADFSASVSNRPYESPQQLKKYQQFMLTHTDQALLLYDAENEGKTEYDLKAINIFQQYHPYELSTIDFDDLQDAADDYEQKINDEKSE